MKYQELLSTIFFFNLKFNLKNKHKFECIYHFYVHIELIQNDSLTLFEILYILNDRSENWTCKYIYSGQLGIDTRKKVNFNKIEHIKVLI